MSEIPVEPVAPVQPDAGFQVVNRSVPRRDGAAKVTGQAITYAAAAAGGAAGTGEAG